MITVSPLKKLVSTLEETVGQSIRRMKDGLLVSLGIAFLWYAAAANFATAQEVSAPRWDMPVETVGSDTLDGAVSIRGTIVIPASRVLVWDVLTDYDSLALFIPGMLEARLVSSSDSIKTIFQKGRSRFLIFRKTVSVTLSVTEVKPERLLFELKDGPFHLYRGSWTLREEGGETTVLTYRALAKPAFFSPGFLIKRLMRKDFRNSLEAIRGETRRRLNK